MLQFVPGLGPRKFASLRQSILRIGGVVESRRALLSKRLLGPNVYNSAVAFLRIREKDQLIGQHLHPLDDTRLHPNVYHKNKWAVKIAIDAMEPERPENSEEFAIKSLRDAMANSQDKVRKLFKMTKNEWEGLYGPIFNVLAWDPKKNVSAESWRDNVEELDLEAFANMIENDGMGKWLTHLLMIKWEFRLPFEDPRKPMEPLSGDKLFKLLTGESDFTMRPGREVTGKIIRNGDYGSRVQLLEGDAPAFIPKRNLSDDHVETPDDVVHVGDVVTCIVTDVVTCIVTDVVTCIVTEVKKDHLSLGLSMKYSDFQRLPSQWDRPKGLPPLDFSFLRSAAQRNENEKREEREKHLASLQLNRKKRQNSNGNAENDAFGDNNQEEGRRTGSVTRRASAHPAFRNARHDEVDKELRVGGSQWLGRR